MNQNAPQPSFELPSVPNEGAEVQAPESQPARPEQSLQPKVPTTQSQQPQIAAQPMIPIRQVEAQSTSAPTQSQGLTVPLIADDAELIEKEWVMKAKQIVAATKEDPFTQTKEMSKFKADYLRKRYNKDLKIEES